MVREQSDLTCSLYGAFRLIELRQDFADPRKETFSPLFEHRADIGRSEDSGGFRMRFSLSNTAAMDRGHVPPPQRGIERLFRAAGD